MSGVPAGCTSLVYTLHSTTPQVPPLGGCPALLTGSASPTPQLVEFVISSRK